MSIGFNLFSLDTFRIFRVNDRKAEFDPFETPLPPIESLDQSDDRDREQEAEIAFWGLACYPVI